MERAHGSTEHAVQAMPGFHQAGIGPRQSVDVARYEVVGREQKKKSEDIVIEVHGGWRMIIAR